MDEQREDFAARVARLQANRGGGPTALIGPGDVPDEQRRTMDLTSEHLAAGANPLAPYRRLSKRDLKGVEVMDSGTATMRLVIGVVGIIFGLITIPLSEYIWDASRFTRALGGFAGIWSAVPGAVVFSGLLVFGLIYLSITCRSTVPFLAFAMAALITWRLLPNMVARAPERWAPFMSADWIEHQTHISRRRPADLGGDTAEDETQESCRDEDGHVKFGFRC